ncbi:MAK10-like protein [Tanacetum coccineum]|uniref:MAK10-like protein n=1 Tax=Tanacetum coccineum TaxID=301880 RepID=A0ABQ5CKM2_9ASTR
MQTSSEVANPRASLAQVETHSRRPEKVMWYFTFGRHLEELHVTWAHLEKKQTRLRTYIDITQDNVLSSWRRRHQYNVTPSQRRPRRRHGISQRRQSIRPSPLSSKILVVLLLVMDMHVRRTIDQSAGGKLCDLNAEESWALLEDLALYDNESWNDPRDFAKPVKVIALPQYAPMALTTLIIAWKILNKPLLNTHPRVLMKQEQPMVEIEPQQPEEPEPTLEDKFKDLHLNLLVFEVLAHAPIYNAILDKYVESLELGKNRSTFVQGEILAKMGDPGLFTLPCRLGDSKPFDTLADLGSCVNIIPLYLFKKLNIGLLEETDHIFGLADGTKSYPVGIVRDVEVRIGKLKLLNDFYVLNMKKDPETPLLIGRGFLATANTVIDCRMSKIAVGEGITRSVFGVKGVDLGEEEAPYWTTLGKRESYKPWRSSDEIGVKPPYYARKDFLDCHLPGEWEISRDAKLNPFKDTLVFRRMVEFLGAIPINLKLYLMRRSLEVLRKFHWMILGGRFNQLSHVSSPLLSKPGEY